MGEGFSPQVRVHEAQRPEATARGAQSTDVWERELGGVADDDVLDRARAMDQHAHLSPGGEGGVDERPCELGGSDAVGGNAAAKDALDGAGVTGRKTVDIAEDLDGTPPVR